MALQLDGYTDSFGNTYSAAYVRITALSTSIPHDGSTPILYSIWKDQASRTGGFAPIATEKATLTVNPFSANAAADAYTELSQSGGIFTNSIDVLQGQHQNFHSK